MMKRQYTSNNAKDKAANVIKILFQIQAGLKRNGEMSTQFVEKFVLVTRLKKNIAIFQNDSRFLK